MMTAKFTLLPESSFDNEAFKIKDISQIKIVYLDWSENVVVFHLKWNKEMVVTANQISVYENRLILDGVRYIILHMFSTDKCQNSPKPSSSLAN